MAGCTGSTSFRVALRFTGSCLIIMTTLTVTKDHCMVNTIYITPTGRFMTAVAHLPRINMPGRLAYGN